MTAVRARSHRSRVHEHVDTSACDRDGTQIGVTVMHYPASGWPTPAADPAADALAEIVELLAQPRPGPWVAQGRCRRTQVDPGLFQPVGDEDSIGYRRQARQAKAVCRHCPVLAQCRAWALAHDETGVWGATTPEQRRSQLAARERRRTRQATTTTPAETPAAALRPAS
ncbi:MAG: WhiB family transcriptional regulator [Actinomycetes bacterium]